MATSKNQRRKLAKKITRPVKTKPFHVAKETNPFLSLYVTRQTIYWSILAVYILVLSVWVLKIQVDTLDIINKLQ